MATSAYVYAGGTVDADGHWHVKQYNKVDLTATGVESPDLAGDIQALVRDQDAGFVYASGGTSPYYIKKLKVSDLTVVATSADYGGVIYAITQDANFIYIAGGTTKTIVKLNKSDLTVAATSPSYDAVVYALTQDTLYVYAGGGQFERFVKQYNKSDLSLVQASPAKYNVPQGAGDINGLANDAGFVYAVGFTGGAVAKVEQRQKSDLVLTLSGDDYADSFRCVAQDASFVYAGGSFTQRIMKYQKSDLTSVAQTPDYSGVIQAVVQDSTHVYYGGGTAKTIKKVAKSDITTILATSPNYLSAILALAVELELEKRKGWVQII